MEIQRSHSRFLSVLQHCLHSFNLVKNLQTMAALGSTEADGGRCDLVRSGGLDLTHEVLHNLLVTTVIILIYKVLSGSVSMKEKSAYIYIHTDTHMHIHICVHVCMQRYTKVTTKEALKVCWSQTLLARAQKSQSESSQLGTRAASAGTWLCSACC